MMLKLHELIFGHVGAAEQAYIPSSEKLVVANMFANNSLHIQ